MYRSAFFLFLLTLIVFYSCTRPLKDITYMYEMKSDTIYKDGPIPDEYEIRINDYLYIQIISDDPENSKFLNLTEQGKSVGGGGGDLSTSSYIVDEQGYISFLLMGKIYVAGSTVNQVRDTLQNKIDKYLDNTAVFVSIVARTITVLGEVESPGQHRMIKSRLSIFEALGTASDVTDWGNYKEVRLIRETPEGKLVADIDLTSPNLIDSPYYYILPNDVLYVKPADRVWGIKTMGAFEPYFLAVSFLTTALLIVAIFQ